MAIASRNKGQKKSAAVVQHYSMIAAEIKKHIKTNFTIDCGEIVGGELKGSKLITISCDSITLDAIAALHKEGIILSRISANESQLTIYFTYNHGK